MKKLMILFLLPFVWFFSSCELENVPFEWEVVVESIWEVKDFDSLKWDEILSLKVLEEEEDLDAFIYVKKENWEEYNISPSIFLEWSQIYFKGNITFLWEKDDWLHYMAEEVIKLSEFIN